MNYLISIIPILLYLIGIKAMDAMSFTNWRRLTICILAGSLSCYVASQVTPYFDNAQTGVIPFVEETLKALFILYLIYNNRGRKKFSIAFFAEAMVYGMAVGAGFALVENTLYVLYNPYMTLLHCIIRGCGTALLHMGCTALVATILVIASRKRRNAMISSSDSNLTIQNKQDPARRSSTYLSLFTFIFGIVLALLSATAIHTLYNLFVIPAFVQLLVTVVLFLIIFMYLYTVEEKLINRWLDASINDDIKLLGAIKDGNLATTRAGEYLLTVKDSFQPEIFFDMLVFLQLYLELSIKAKSRLIMREAGLSFPIPPAEHQDDVQRTKELRTLRRNIGVAGITVLSPLIHVKNADTWVINELL